MKKIIKFIRAAFGSDNTEVALGSKAEGGAMTAKSFDEFPYERGMKGTGAVEDPRPESEKIKDYQQDEILASANPVDWSEKPKEQWRRFPIFDQNGSGSCVAQTLAKLLAVRLWLNEGTYIHFSATHIYQRRKNRPDGGMWATDAFDIATQGTTLEVLAPSQGMRDSEMDNMVIEDYKKRVGEVFKVPNYVSLPVKDFDRVASTIQTTGKAVMVWFYFMRNEWTDRPFLADKNLPERGNGVVRHSVTAIDAFSYEGKQYLLIEDSWGEQYGLGGQRLISREFYEARNFYAGYPIAFSFQTEPVNPQKPPRKPYYTFSNPLRFSPTFSVNEEVKKLQDILKFEQLFPSNVDSTGYYGAITAKAVLAFQRRYKVAGEAELTRLGGRLVGVKTRAKLNELYGN